MVCCQSWPPGVGYVLSVRMGSWEHSYPSILEVSSLVRTLWRVWSCLVSEHDTTPGTTANKWGFDTKFVDKSTISRTATANLFLNLPESSINRRKTLVFGAFLGVLRRVGRCRQDCARCRQERLERIVPKRDESALVVLVVPVPKGTSPSHCLTPATRSTCSVQRQHLMHCST